MKIKKLYNSFIIGVIGALFLANCKSNITYATETEKACDVVFALDISGSMKKTDENRTAIEAMKMMIDICDEEDRVGVVAYNDTIAYNFELTEINKQEQCVQLKNMINTIEYRGETDIGLGVKRAVEMLGVQEKNREKMVILLSDGKTDLANSLTGRTLEQSQQDLTQSVEQAEKENISIHTIGFANEYLEDSDYLSIISADTGGTTHIAASPLQLNQIMNQIIYSYKKGNTTLTKVIDLNNEVQEQQIEIEGNNVKKAYVNILCTGELYQIQVDNEECEILQSQKYAVIKWNNPQKTSLELTFQGSAGAKMLLNMVEMNNEESTPIPTLSPTPPITIKPTVVTIVPEPIQKDNTTWHIGIVIFGIIFITICLMTIIIYMFFKKSDKQKYPTFEGKLAGEFIDLKSKNESVSLVWQLNEYPEEGVTLKELFHGAEFQEDLPDLDRLCFYPYKNHQILLVHCMEGGVFLGEENIFPNKPVRIHGGDTIYISFVENSSELELKYTL